MSLFGWTFSYLSVKISTATSKRENPLRLAAAMSSLK